jgi:putative oxidoreductase
MTNQAVSVQWKRNHKQGKNIMDKFLSIAARLLMAQIFIISGFSKISGYAGTQMYMDKMGVPGMLLPLVILLELGGGILLLLGFQARWAALALALFSIASAVLFHSNVGDQMQMIQFMKNLALAGGLLMVVQFGAGKPSIDERA